VVGFPIVRDENGLPDYEYAMNLYSKIHQDIRDGKIISAYEVERNGLCEALTKMALGNRLGIRLADSVQTEELFRSGWGSLVTEVPADMLYQLSAPGMFLGEVTREPEIVYKDMVLSLEEIQAAWTKPLEKVFPTRSGTGLEKACPDCLGAASENVEKPLYEAKSVYICTHKIGTPNVFIPVFPGTNCEYDSAKAFEDAGANVEVKVFRNITADNIRKSVDYFAASIDQAQILMFPGGFSAGDEPEGSAKFFATVFRNEKMKEAVNRLLQERDGLILGICNGFQALIKLGLVPYGEICDQAKDSPTLTYNAIGRHVSKMAYTKVVSNKSPWFAKAGLGDVYCTPVSHGEGRFVANGQWIEKLFANGQVATQYVNFHNTPTMDEEWNPNGSYYAIEGITSPDGRVLGKMAHSERKGKSVAVNIYGERNMRLFESGVGYFL